MRLLERPPELPKREGEFWTHNTGGEHATKYVGREYAINALRQELTRVDGSEVKPIESDKFVDMLLYDEAEIVFIEHRANPQAGLTTAGVAIGERSAQGKFDRRMKLVEMVVDSKFRQKKVASYMLGRITTLEYGGSGLTEMVLDTSCYEVPDFLLECLDDADFAHRDETGSPAIWLPGVRAFPRVNRDDPKVVEEIVAAMPEGWNGYFDVSPNNDFQLQVFRGGKLKGIVRPVEDSITYTDEDEMVRDYTLNDAGDALLDRVEKVTENEALRALLNNYYLLETSPLV